VKYNEIKEIARKFRKTPTASERKLWSILRLRKLEGKKFLRQHPIMFENNGKRSFFIADFYCAENKLVLELDGGIHDIQEMRDRERDLILENKGMRVLRIRNEELKNSSEEEKKIRNVLVQSRENSIRKLSTIETEK
jgi:very-short-patch-repair endonuclease